MIPLKKLTYLLTVSFGLLGSNLHATDAPSAPPAKLKGTHGELTICPPISHKNLSVYLIRGSGHQQNLKILTLSEAMQSGVTVVHETSDVNQLRIENKSTDSYVFIHSGDIVKGGKQDRALANSLLIPPTSKLVPVQSFCVERSRWEKRTGEKLSEFNAQTKCLNSNGLKIASRKHKDQSAVWSNVAETQSKLSNNVYKGEQAGRSVNSAVSATSLQLTLENKDLIKLTKEYTEGIQRKLPQHHDIIGYAFAVNGDFQCSDIYLNQTLFHKLWKLRLESAASQAISDFSADAKFATPTAASIAISIASNRNDSVKGEKLAAHNQLETQENQDNITFIASHFVEQKKSTYFHHNTLAKHGYKAPKVQSDTLLNNINGLQVAPESQTENLQQEVEQISPDGGK